MGKKTEIKNVERLEMMEDKCGVTLDGIYAEYESIDTDSNYVNVRGEIQAKSGTKIDESLDIIITAYNSDGKVIATSSQEFDADNFFGISPFDICTGIIEKPVKIRVYPKIS
jgi:hypothetical protein